MTHELVTEADNSPIKQFQEKVAERIRDDIGELMPDEMLQEIVKQTIEAELNRPVRGSGYSDEPWIRKQIKDCISSNLQLVVSKAISEQEKAVKKAAVEAVKEAIPNAIAEIVLALLKGNAYGLENMIRDFMTQRGNY